MAIVLQGNFASANGAGDEENSTGKEVMTDSQTQAVPCPGSLAQPRSHKRSEAAAIDDELVERVRKGDRDAYRFIVEKYQRGLISTVYDIVKNRQDAEDVVQESFVKAFLSLDRFRGQSSFRTYLFRIAVNLAIDYRRKIQRRGGPPRELEPERHVAETIHDDPHRKVSVRQELEGLSAALETLSEDHRRAILLRELEGMSYQEIAKVVGVTVGTVMSRLHYARKKIQAAFAEKTGKK